MRLICWFLGGHDLTYCGHRECSFVHWCRRCRRSYP